MKRRMICVIMIALLFSMMPGASFAAGQIIAKPASAKVKIDDTYYAFEAYNIDGNNYFKLRDLARGFGEGEKYFNVEYDASSNAVRINSNEYYMMLFDIESDAFVYEFAKEPKQAVPTMQRVFIDDQEVSLAAYNIDGNNFFKLRDVGEAMGFPVEWDNAAKTILMQTSGFEQEITREVRVKSFSELKAALEQEEQPQVTRTIVILDQDISDAKEMIKLPDQDDFMFTLDLNGHTIISTGTVSEFTLFSNESEGFIIRDTAGGGKIADDGKGDANILVRNGGVLTLESGSLSAAGTGAMCIKNDFNCRFVMNGGGIYASGETYCALYNDAVAELNGGEIFVSGMRGIINEGMPILEKGDRNTPARDGRILVDTLLILNDVKMHGISPVMVSNRGMMIQNDGQIKFTGEESCGVYNTGGTTEVWVSEDKTEIVEAACALFIMNGGTITAEGKSSVGIAYGDERAAPVLRKGVVTSKDSFPIAKTTMDLKKKSNTEVAGKYLPSEDGTAILIEEKERAVTRNAPPEMAKPSEVMIYVNGKSYPFKPFNVNGSHYIDLYELQEALAETAKDVGITQYYALRGAAFSAGTSMYDNVLENGGKDGLDKEAYAIKPRVFVEKDEVTCRSYEIGGYPYYNLEDMAKNLDFSMKWDDTVKAILIDTSKPYVGD